MEIDSCAFPHVCENEKPSETELPEATVPGRVARSSRLRMEDGLGADNVIDAPTNKGGLSMGRARSATLKSSNDQKRRRMTEKSIESGEVDYYDKAHPLDAVQRPSSCATPARFWTQDQDEGGRDHGRDSSRNTIVTKKVNYCTRRKAKDEADEVSIADSHSGSAIQSLRLIPDIGQHSSTKSATSAIARRTSARKFANIAKDLTNPFKVAVSPDWDLMPDLDRRVYLLQSGVPMGGDAIPLKWSEVVQILVGEGYFERKQFMEWGGEKELQNRYEQIRVAVQGRYADREPKIRTAWPIFRCEGFDVYDYKDSRTSYVHREVYPLMLDSKGFLSIGRSSCRNDEMLVKIDIEGAWTDGSESRDIPNPNLRSQTNSSCILLAQTDDSQRHWSTQHAGGITGRPLLNTNNKDLAMDEVVRECSTKTSIASTDNATTISTPLGDPMQSQRHMDEVKKSEKYKAHWEYTINRKYQEVEASATAATTESQQQVHDEREEDRATKEADETVTNIRHFTGSPDLDSHGRSIGLGSKCDSSAYLTGRVSPACARQTDLFNWKTEKHNTGTAEVSTDSDQITPPLGHTAKSFSRTRQPAQIPIHEDEPGTAPRVRRIRPANFLDPDGAKENREVDSEAYLATTESPELPGTPVAGSSSVHIWDQFENHFPVASPPPFHRTLLRGASPESHSQRISSDSFDRRRTLFGPFATPGTRSSVRRAIVTDFARASNVINPTPLASRTERPTATDTVLPLTRPR